jgi:hypothetical protein
MIDNINLELFCTIPNKTCTMSLRPAPRAKKKSPPGGSDFVGNKFFLIEQNFHILIRSGNARDPEFLNQNGDDMG